MAFLHRHRTAEKTASQTSTRPTKSSTPPQDKQQEEDTIAQHKLHVKLEKINKNYKEKKPPAAMYDGVRKDIKNLGQEATFGDVLSLLRRGPSLSKTSNATEVLQGIRSLKAMADRENIDAGPVANLLKQLMMGGSVGNGSGTVLPVLPVTGGRTDEQDQTPENGLAHCVQLKHQRGSLKRKVNDGSFGVPDGADIRSKGCTKLWIAKRQETQDKEEQNDKKGTKRMNTRTSINCMAVQYSKSRSHAIIGTGCGDVQVIDLGTGRTVPNLEKMETKEMLTARAEPLTLQGHEGYVSSALGVGQLCFTASLDASIRGWKYDSMEEVVKSNGHQSAVHDLCYSFSKRIIYSASGDGTVRMWDLAKGKSNILCEHFESACYSIAINEKRGGQLYVGLDSGSIGVIDAGSGAVISDLKGHDSMVSSLSFSSNAGLLVSGSSDSTCRIFFAGSSIVEYQHHECPIYAVTFVQNGSAVLSGGTDGAIHRWSSSTGVCQTVYRHFDQDTIFALACHNGNLLVGGRDGTLRCWAPTVPCEFCPTRCGTKNNGGSTGLHSNGCDFELIQCTNNCDMVCYRHELSMHLIHCPKRRLRCTNPGCRDVMMYEELEKHQSESCPCSRVQCPNSIANGGWGCTMSLRRRNLPSHLLECFDPLLLVKQKTGVSPALPSSTKSPGMKGRKAKLELPTMKSKGVRVKIPLRTSAAGRKLHREKLKVKAMHEENK